MIYPLLSRLIHWSSALIIGGLLFVGLYMTDLAFSDFKLDLYLWHKSFGLLVFLLLVLRIGVFLFAGRPKPLDSHQKWERILSKVVHFVLYGALLLMPLSGWVMSSAGDYTVRFFGIHLPDIVSKNEPLFEAAKEFHGILAFVLMGAIGLHVLGALKHHFVDRDETLRRMTFSGFGMKSGVILTVFVLVFGALIVSQIDFEEEVAEPEQRAGVQSLGVSDAEMVSSAPEWAIDLAQSSLIFTASQYGQTFEGRFENFGGQIFFDPGRLEESKVRIEIDISSLETGSADRDQQALSAAWFDAAQYPRAVFSADKFTVVDGQYSAHGRLSVRDSELPFDLPFVLDIDGNQAVMRAQFSLNRLDYNVGTGQSENIVSHAISFEITVHAHRK